MSRSAIIEISGTEVQSKVEYGEQVILVDVRQSWEYENAHIPGVLLMPMNEIPERCEAELSRNAEIICLCEHGIRSKAAAHYLSGLGYTNVATMTGGMASYHGSTESSLKSSYLEEEN